MINKILVVCIGNICRSPTAEFLLKKNLPNKEIASAGLFAMTGKDMDAQARKIAEQHGYVFPEHCAQQFSSDLAKDYDLILVMEQQHRDIISEKYPEVLAKTMLLGRWADNRDIPDPYRKSDEVFEQIFRLIESSTSAWVDKLRLS